MSASRDDYAVRKGIRQQFQNERVAGRRHKKCQWMEQVGKLDLQQAIENKDPDKRWALIDYRNDNEVMRKSTMTCLEAARRNKILTGSGMAWARISQ